MREPATQVIPAGTFEDDVTHVLRRLRTTIAGVIAALPGNVAKAADLHRALKLDMKLSWKLFKVVGAADPVAAGPHVPGPANLRTFLRAAAKKGVPAPLIDAATRAAAEFQAIVATHAGERDAFDSMVSGLAAGDANDQLHFQQKRAAFRANRHIWGLQAKTHLRCVVIQPATGQDVLSLAIVQGFINLRRIRSNAPLVISRDRIKNNDGTLRQVDREPLDPGGSTAHGIALLREFCSHPLPEFHTVNGDAGFVHGELVSNGVGNRAATTCLEGHLIRAAGPRYREPGNELLRATVRVRIPCEVLICDVLVRDGTVKPGPPVAGVYAEDLSGGPGVGGPQERDRLELQESVVYLGRGASVLHTPDVPNYADLARYVFARVGWDADQFDVYRCRVEYPVMATTVRVSFELPDAVSA